MAKKKKPWTLQEELDELERTDPAVRKAAENYDKMVQKIITKPICVGCKREPKQILEYKAASDREGIAADEYVKREEGTYNRKNGHFWCTECYIEAGQPLGKAP